MSVKKKTVREAKIKQLRGVPGAKQKPLMIRRGKRLGGAGLSNV